MPLSRHGLPFMVALSGILAIALGQASTEEVEKAQTGPKPIIFTSDDVPGVIEMHEDHAASEEHEVADHEAHEGHEGHEGSHEGHEGGHEAHEGGHEHGGHEEHGHEGHHHEGGHEHGGHEEHGHEGHHHISTAMMTTSYLLIGFLLTNIVMFQLINYQDANVRSYTWKMLSATISIYLAVVLDTTLDAMVLECFREMGMENESAIMVGHLCIGVIIFAAWFSALTLVSHAIVKRTEKVGLARSRVFTVTTIGGHLTAFAGIGCIEAIEELGTSDFKMWIVTALIVACLFGARVASKKARAKYLGVKEEEGEKKEDAESQVQLCQAPPKTFNAWPEMTCEGEDEACAIIQSYLVKELIMGFFFIGSKEATFAEHSTYDIMKLTIVEAVVLVLVLLSTYWVKLLDKHLSGESGGHAYARAVENLQGTLAMTMSWLALYLFFWISMAFFKVSHHFIEVISAAILTIVAVILIIGLDFIADKIGEKGARQNSEQNLGRLRRAGPTPESGFSTVGHAREETPTAAADDKLVTAVSAVVPEDLMKELVDTKNFEKAIRTIINGIALSVGLAWEHAFHAASLTVVESNAVLASRPIFAKIVMTGVSYYLMLPVWTKIAKNASKSVEEHQKLLDAALQQDE